MASPSLPSPRTRARDVAVQVAALARRLLGRDIRIFWFGSWPEGRAVDRSDVDVGILAHRPIPLDQMSRLRAAVEELPTLFTIDIADLNSVEVTLRDHVESRGMPL